MGKKASTYVYWELHYIGAYNVAGNFTYKQKITVKNINDKYYVNEYEQDRQCTYSITTKSVGATVAAVEE